MQQRDSHARVRPYRPLDEEAGPSKVLDRPITPGESITHILKANIGPGVLALPLHFAAVGPSVGLLVLFAVASQGTYGMWILVKVQQRAAELVSAKALPQPLGFEDLGELAYGRAGRRVVQVCVMAVQLGVCTVSLALVSYNLGAALPLGWPQAVLLAYAPCALLCLLPDLRSIAPLSRLGTAAMLLTLGTVVAFTALEIAGLGTGLLPFSAAKSTEEATDEDALAGGVDEPKPERLVRHAGEPTLARVAGAASACFYAFEGIGTVLPIGNSLAPADAPRYPSLLVRALGAVAAIFAISATLTALAFPAIDSASSIAFLATRYRDARNGQAAIFALCDLLVVAAVVLTFPLQLTPAALVLEASCGLRSRRARAACRVGAAGGCCLLVLVVPNLSSLIDLVGSVANTALAALPCLLHAWLLLALPGFRAAGPPDDVQPHPPLCAAEWRALTLDAAVVAFCSGVFIVGFTEALREIGGAED